MRSIFTALAGAALAYAHGGDHGHQAGKWDWNGGYPNRGCNGQHLPGNSPTPGSQNATFQQLIDHKNPSLGTFSQFYFYDTTHWKGPGSPVILFTPGEVNATRYTSYLTTNRKSNFTTRSHGITPHVTIADLYTLRSFSTEMVIDSVLIITLPTGTTGVLAQEIGAATIVLEHRYWGELRSVSGSTG